jgi:hypothetical protein
MVRELVDDEGSRKALQKDQRAVLPGALAAPQSPQTLSV